MATTTVSIGSNQSIDTETPATSSGSGPSYTVTFGTTPTGIHIGDIGFMETQEAGGGAGSDYTFLVTGISGANITLKYLTDTGGSGDASPLGLYDGSGSSSSPNQAAMVFKRAFSTITLFEAMIDDASPDYWGATDDVVGELHADSNFTDATVTFDSKQSLSSVTLSVYSDDRHDGTAESGALWKPTANSGHNQGILRINIENMTTEWLDISLDSLDSRNTNKAIVLAGTNDDNIIRNNLIHDKGGNPGSYGPVIIQGLGAGSSGDNIYILNNILYNFVESSNDSTSGIVFWSYQRTLYIYNNTIYKLTGQGGNKDAIGIRFANQPSSVTYIKNNIVSTLSANDDKRAYFKENGSSTVHASNNLSDTTTETAYNAEDMGGNLNDSTALTGQSLADISFVSTTGGSEDLHLDTDSVCLEAGADLGTTNGVNIDIDGVDRDATGVTWDIGADQKSEAALTGNPAFLMFVD
jgi:hypothetical protein